MFSVNRCLAIGIGLGAACFSAAHAGDMIAVAESADGKIAVVLNASELMPALLRGSVWVGCTIWDGSEEVDLDAHRVGLDRISLAEMFIVPRHVSKGRHDAVVTLWRKRVEKRDCSNGRRGQPCQWCRAHGYHLEDPIDREYFTVTVGQ